MTRLIPLILLLAGCAAAPDRSPPVPAVVVDDGVPLGALPRQTLAAGECGIFLWKTGPAARLILTAKANPPVARIMLAGRVIDLPRVAGSGDGAGGIQTETRYSDGRTSLTIDLTIEQRPGLTQGAAIPAGGLRLDTGAGESFAMPVTGLLACMPAAGTSR